MKIPPAFGEGYLGKINILFVLLAGAVFLFSCQKLAVLPRATSMAYRVAFNRNTVEGYQKFLRASPNDPYVDEARVKLAELLLQENDRKDIEEFVHQFPEERSMVQSSLDEFALIDEVLERYNEHDTLKRDNSNLSIRRGEPYYAYLYAKNFVGFVDPEEGEYDFYVKIERVIAPHFINVVLLPESFALAQRFHSMTNIYYKIIVSYESPLGEYPIQALFGLYMTINDGNEERVGGTAAKHVVKIIDENVHTLRGIEIADKSIDYFSDEVNGLEEKAAKLADPGINEFAPYYLYMLESSQYNIEIEKKSLFQSIALHGLKKAGNSPDKTLKHEASRVLQEVKEKLQEKKLQIKEFVPFK